MKRKILLIDFMVTISNLNRLNITPYIYIYIEIANFAFLYKNFNNWWNKLTDWNIDGITHEYDRNNELITIQIDAQQMIIHFNRNE